MARSRVLYALTLLGAVLFHIFYVDYLSLYVLILAIAFPILALVVSLPAMLGLSCRLTAPAGRVCRGEEGLFLLRLHNRRSLPLARVSVRITTANLMTGAEKTLRPRVSLPSGGATLRASVDTAHCGRWVCTVTRLRVCDLLGLFSLSRPLPKPCSLLVLPLELPAESTLERALQLHAPPTLRPRPGGGPGEDYDLRPYRPGDPLRAVHWKLSAKVGDLMVKETLEEHRPALVLTLDHFGTHQALDLTLDRLSAISRYLIGRHKPHEIQWANPVTGARQRCCVEDWESLCRCLWAIGTEPTPLEGASILDRPLWAGADNRAIRHLHVMPLADGEVRP